MVAPRKSLSVILWAATAILLIGVTACQRDASGTGVVVRKPWTRPAPAGGVGGGFMEITNTGPGPVTLVGLASSRAERVELHQTVETGGVYSMTDFPNGIVIPAHGKLKLAPGGYHAMMVGLKARTEPGQTAPVTLTLNRGGKTLTVEVSLAVQNSAP